MNINKVALGDLLDFTEMTEKFEGIKSIDLTEPNTFSQTGVVFFGLRVTDLNLVPKSRAEPQQQSNGLRERHSMTAARSPIVQLLVFFYQEVLEEEQQMQEEEEEEELEVLLEEQQRGAAAVRRTCRASEPPPEVEDGVARREQSRVCTLKVA
jgi:hypothetical protein